MQFLDGKAKREVADFEGVQGGLKKALNILEQIFGQPHIVVKACIDTLIDGPVISNSDKQGLCDFADKSSMVFETLL